MKFVDASDQTSNPSPTPRVMFVSHATLEHPANLGLGDITARGDQVSKRLMYETLSNDSGACRSAVTSRHQPIKAQAKLVNTRR